MLGPAVPQWSVKDGAAMALQQRQRSDATLGVFLEALQSSRYIGAWIVALLRMCAVHICCAAVTKLTEPAGASSPLEPCSVRTHTRCYRLN